MVGDSLIYLDAVFSGDNVEGVVLYNPDGVVLVGEGGIICDDGRTLTAAKLFERLCVVSANGDMI